jgi:hypothetical protein
MEILALKTTYVCVTTVKFTSLNSLKTTYVCVTTVKFTSLNSLREPSVSTSSAYSLPPPAMTPGMGVSSPCACLRSVSSASPRLCAGSVDTTTVSYPSSANLTPSAAALLVCCFSSGVREVRLGRVETRIRVINNCSNSSSWW